MKSVRLLPVVVLAVSALLVLKTVGLVTTGSYVLGGVTAVRAAETAEAAIVLPAEPTMADSGPTLADMAPTLGTAEPGSDPAAAADHAGPAAAGGEPGAAAPAEGGHDAAEAVLPKGFELACAPGDAPEGCVPLIDAKPTRLDDIGQPVALVGEDGQSLSERALLGRLAERRTQLETYEHELSLRAALVDAAEKKLDERQTTLQALETQIAGLVDQRKELETGQFAGIVTLYENMKPKDAANIFNALDMDVLLRVAKTMSPRKMSPILAAMDSTRAQELTVRMAALADQPAEQMSVTDLAALPQIVGQ